MRVLPNNCPPVMAIEPKDWSDKPLAIVGTGPSLKGFDFSRLDLPGVRSLAVKEAIWDMPFAAAVFALHRPWIALKERELTELRTEKIFAVEPEFGPCPAIPGATYVLRTRYPGLSEKMTEISSGGNSGFGAFNVATLRGAKKICLFGFDYTEVAGQHHHRNEQYHWYTSQQNLRYWDAWGHAFNDCRKQLAAWGVEVVNASPVSTVPTFPKVSIDDGIEWLRKQSR